MALHTLVNGIESTSLLVSDRGLHYGDGLFETLLIVNGKPQHWDKHLARLYEGCQRLAIVRPCEKSLWDEAARLSLGQDKAVLKIIVTRGSGGRGYRSLKPPEAPEPTRIVQVFSYPDYPASFWQQGVSLRMCHTRLACQPQLAGIKHLNRLENVLARNEWEDAQIPEGVMKDSAGHWIEGTMTNLFCVKNSQLYTPDLSHCGVLGIMRQIILEKAATLGIQCTIQAIDDAFANLADELFICNSLIGIWSVQRVEGKTYSFGPIATQLSKNLIC